MAEPSRSQRLLLLLASLTLIAFVAPACGDDAVADGGDGMAIDLFADGTGRIVVLGLTDVDIEEYAWYEQKLVLSQSAAARLRAALQQQPMLVFQLFFEGTLIGTGPVRQLMSPIADPGPQLRWDLPFVWLAFGPVPVGGSAIAGSEVLRRYGIAEETIDRIQRHFEESGRLR